MPQTKQSGNLAKRQTSSNMQTAITTRNLNSVQKPLSYSFMTQLGSIGSSPARLFQCLASMTFGSYLVRVRDLYSTLNARKRGKSSVNHTQMQREHRSLLRRCP